MMIIDKPLTDAEIIERVRLLHTGEARVLIAFSAEELGHIAVACVPHVSDRALTALDLIDPEQAEALRLGIKAVRGE